MSVSIALVEDVASLRQRFLEKMAFFPDIQVCFVATSGESFLEQMARLPVDQRPQVVLMDIELPGLSGIETTLALKNQYPDVEVMMLTVFEQEEKIFLSLQAGASGYLLKDASTDQVVGAILNLVQGGAPMSPSVARKMLQYFRESNTIPPSNTAPSSFDLTEREREILDGIVRDETEPALADQLHISPHTVRSHIKNIYKKLHVHSRAAAVRVALKNNLTGF